MTFADAIRTCHVRSAIYRSSIGKQVRHWKNHLQPLAWRVPESDQLADDWEEFDPREEPECSAYEEMPA